MMRRGDDILRDSHGRDATRTVPSQMRNSPQVMLDEHVLGAPISCLENVVDRYVVLKRQRSGPRSDFVRSCI